VAGEEYRRIVLTFWTDPEVKRPLTRDQKLLLLYFCTSPHSNMIGLYYCPLAYASNETDIPVEEVRKHVHGPLAKFLSYDEQTEEVFVHALAKHNLGDELTIGTDKRTGDPKPDHRIGAVKKLLEACHSTRLVRLFLQKYGERYHLEMPLPDNREAPTEPLASPYPSPSEAKAVTKHSITEQGSSTNGVGLTVIGSVMPVKAKNLEAVESRLAEVMASVASNGSLRLRAEEMRRVQAALVFSYWCRMLDHPKALLDADRERRLTKRLEENQGDVHELLYVVDGALKDDWTMGRSPRNTKKFDGIETIYQDRAHVEKFAGLCAGHKRGDPHPVAVQYLETGQEVA
jgi:hypothetical protein